MEHVDFDAVVVGSGPNGLAAAITLQQAGLAVLLLEGKDRIGGGMRTEALTLPGFLHDVCSAVHPMAMLSPFFRSLSLESYGLEFIHPDIPAAHPFAEGRTAFLHRSPGETARGLGPDEKAYLGLMTPLLKAWPRIEASVLGPLRFPRSPLEMVRFGWKALAPASRISRRFSTQEALGLWAGVAAHSLSPLSQPGTASIGLVLMLAAHTGGWPFAKGGSRTIAEALASCFKALGGRIETGIQVKDLRQLPSCKALLLDLTPRQLLRLAGHRFSSLYRWQLERFRYGPGVFKLDWAMDEAIPFRDPACFRAGTLHLGGTYAEIAFAEGAVARGRHPERPFVLLAQPSIFDPSRAPEGKHTAWAYCHVPAGSSRDMTNAMEEQVERVAPGFRERILARHAMNSAAMEEYNPNYVGGDIAGGAFRADQIFSRPALRASPYRTSAKGIYICSSSSPPGGGVHGMCGYHAARRTLKDLFGR